MDHNSSEVGIKFGELQKEERYKKLERSLKLTFIKQMEQAKTHLGQGYCMSPTWPSLSSINADTMDTTAANPSLQVSRVGSEVVSSSSNLHKALVVKRYTNLPIATSSVKKFPISDFDRDRAIMPPPPVTSVYCNHPKVTIENDSKGTQWSQLSKRSNTEREISESTNANSSNTSVHQDNSNSVFQQDSKAHRVFKRWRILLNDHGEMIIKGTLADCGKIARSKPIMQRLSRNKVKSVYKHIYLLDGNIVDDRCELPEYVRGKFFNGFPDDWENVHQLWKNYTSKGCKLSFRWPTPITDSDDDLATEITDFTLCKNKDVVPKEAVHHSNTTVNNATSSGYYSKSQTDSIQNCGKSSAEKVAVKPSETVNKKVQDLANDSEIKEVDVNGFKEHDDCSNSKDCSNFSNNCSNLKYSAYLHEMLQEDKLRVIRLNLGDKNCPPEYLDKFIQLIDCLRYLLSFTPSSEMDTKCQLQHCLKSSSIASFSESQEINADELSSSSRKKNETFKLEENRQKSNDNVSTDPNKKSRLDGNLNHPKTAGRDGEVVMTDSSDSDAYMGIPNIPVQHILKPRTRSERYRDVKTRMAGKKKVHNEKQIEKLAQSVHGQKLLPHDDSSISITENEYESRQMRKNEINNRSTLNKQTPKSHDPLVENVNCNDDRKGIVTTYAKSIGAENVNHKTTPKKRVAERPKPIIKSNEIVNIDLKSRGLSRNPKTIYSDVSIVNEDVPLKRQKLSHIDIDDNEKNDKLTDDLMKHPFLTYDSEDFSDEHDNSKITSQSSYVDKGREKKHLDALKKTNGNNEKVLQESSKNQNKNTKEQERKSRLCLKKKKVLTNEKALKSEPFGSKENPKLLTYWIPCVMYENELKKKINLVFEGKLLNEAGHVVHRKFTTDPVIKRHSATLVETVRNEYFMLVGGVNDTKHVVPKELLNHCRTGCPAKIEEFCKEWKKLLPVLEKSINMNNTSIDLLPIPTSSRGRKCVPTLHFWEGERLVTKDLHTIYQPGDMFDKSLVNQTPLAFNKKKENKNETNITESNMRSSGRITKEENKLLNRTPVKVPNKVDDSTIKTRVNKEIPAESTYNLKLRNRNLLDQKKNVQQNSKTNSRQLRPPSKIVWTYNENQNHYDELLSDDQSSVVK